MAGQQEEIADGPRIEFRMGINVGDVVIDDDDIHGDGVNWSELPEWSVRPKVLGHETAIKDVPQPQQLVGV